MKDLSIGSKLLHFMVKHSCDSFGTLEKFSDLLKMLLLCQFLGAQAPLELAHVKNNNNNKKLRKKFQIAITCSLLLLLAP